jgi:flagellar motor switch protein FliN
MSEENNLEDIEKSLEGNEEALDEVSQEKGSFGGSKYNLTEEQKANLSMILDLPLRVTVELGRARVMIQDILQYGQGSVVELNKKAGDLLEITIGNQLIAKGEVVVVNEKFAVRVLEIVDEETRIKRLALAGKDSPQIITKEEILPETKKESEAKDAGAENSAN